MPVIVIRNFNILNLQSKNLEVMEVSHCWYIHNSDNNNIAGLGFCPLQIYLSRKADNLPPKFPVYICGKDKYSPIEVDLLSTAVPQTDVLAVWWFCTVHGVYQIFIEAAVQVLVSLKGDYCYQRGFVEFDSNICNTNFVSQRLLNHKSLLYAILLICLHECDYIKMYQ